MKKIPILILSIIKFLISFILFLVLGLCMFYKYFGVIGFFWFLSILSMVYSALAVLWTVEDDTATVKK